MVKRALAFSLLAFVLPHAAAGQVPAPRVLGPAAASVGITVNGHGVVRRRPDAIRFTAFLAPQRDGVAAAAAAQTLADALRKNGATDVRTGTPVAGAIGPGAPVTIGGVLRGADETKARDFALRVAAASPGVVVQNVSYGPIADDCDAEEARAIQVAFADARRRASAIAATAAVQLGAPTALSEPVVFMPGCATRPDTRPVPMNGGFGEGGGLDVYVDVNLTVTFAITGEGGARRRPL